MFGIPDPFASLTITVFFCPCKANEPIQKNNSMAIEGTKFSFSKFFILHNLLVKNKNGNDDSFADAAGFFFY